MFKRTLYAGTTDDPCFYCAKWEAIQAGKYSVCERCRHQYSASLTVWLGWKKKVTITLPTSDWSRFMVFYWRSGKVDLKGDAEVYTVTMPYRGMFILWLTHWWKFNWIMQHRLTYKTPDNEWPDIIEPSTK